MKEEIAYIESKIKQLQEGIVLINKYGIQLEDAGASVKAHITTIKVKTLNEVAKVKNILREDYDHFKFQHSFYSHGQVISIWKSPNTNWAIWLETSIEDFPAELKKDSCKWVKTSVTKDDYNLVCEKENV